MKAAAVSWFRWPGTQEQRHWCIYGCRTIGIQCVIPQDWIVPVDNAPFTTSRKRGRPLFLVKDRRGARSHFCVVFPGPSD